MKPPCRSGTVNYSQGVARVDHRVRAAFLRHDKLVMVGHSAVGANKHCSCYRRRSDYSKNLGETGSSGDPFGTSSDCNEGSRVTPAHKLDSSVINPRHLSRGAPNSRHFLGSVNACSGSFSVFTYLSANDAQINCGTFFAAAEVVHSM